MTYRNYQQLTWLDWVPLKLFWIEIESSQNTVCCIGQDLFFFQQDYSLNI